MKISFFLFFIFLSLIGNGATKEQIANRLDKQIKIATWVFDSGIVLTGGFIINYDAWTFVSLDKYIQRVIFTGASVVTVVYLAY